MLTACSLFQGAAQTHNLSVDFGGWSHHFYKLNAQTAKHISYNQSHNLVGLRYTYSNPDNYFEYSIGGNYMVDSFGADAYTFALGASKNLYTNGEFFIDAGGIIAAQNRSWLESVGYRGVKFQRLTVPFVAPEIKIGYQRMYFSTMLVPNVETTTGKARLAAPTLFMQFGVRLT